MSTSIGNLKSSRRSSVTLQDGRSAALSKRWGSMTKSHDAANAKRAADQEMTSVEDTFATASDNALRAVYEQTLRRFNVIEKWTDNCTPEDMPKVFQEVETARSTLLKCKAAIEQGDKNVESLLLTSTIQVNKASSAVRHAGIQDPTKYLVENRVSDSSRFTQQKPPTPKHGSPKLTKVVQKTASLSAEATGQKSFVYSSSPDATEPSRVYTTPSATMQETKKSTRQPFRPLWALDLAVMFGHNKEDIDIVIDSLPQLRKKKYARKHLRELTYEQQCLVTEAIMSLTDDGVDTQDTEISDEAVHEKYEYVNQERKVSPKSDQASPSTRNKSPNFQTEATLDYVSRSEGSHRDAWAHSRRALSTDDHAEHTHLRQRYLDKLHDKYEPFNKWGDNHSKQLREGSGEKQKKQKSWNNLYFKGTPKHAPMGAVSEQRKKGVHVEHTSSVSYGGHSPRHHHNKAPSTRPQTSPSKYTEERYSYTSRGNSSGDKHKARSRIDDHMSKKTMEAAKGQNRDFVRMNILNTSRKSNKTKVPKKSKKQYYHDHIEKERRRNIVHDVPYCEKNSPHGLSTQNWIESLSKRTAGHQHRFVVKKGHAEQEAKRIAARNARRRGSSVRMHKHIHTPEARHHGHVFESHHYH